MKDKVQERKNILKLLFLKAQSMCSSPNDEELVRFIRDNAILQVTRITRGDNAATHEYRLCTNAELKSALRYLENGAEALRNVKPTPDPGRNNYHTASQKKIMHFHLIGCAVHYAPTDVLFTIDGKNYIGIDLLIKRYELFESAKGLPPAVLSQCYKWVIPKVHQFFCSNGYRQYSQKKQLNWDKQTTIDWSTITRDEADGLIKHFKEMYNEIQQRYRPQLLNKKEN